MSEASAPSALKTLGVADAVYLGAVIIADSAKKIVPADEIEAGYARFDDVEVEIARKERTEIAVLVVPAESP